MAIDRGNTPEMQNPEDWSRRQFLIGAGGVTVVALGALFAKNPIANAFRSISGTTVDSGLVHVYQGDFYFVPNHMTWRVGQHMSLLLHNASPNRFHEMQLGRGAETTPSLYGPVVTQFYEDFWDQVHVTVADANLVDNFTTNKAIVTCNVNPHPWILSGAGNGNFSPTLFPGGHILLEFDVPNKPGRWEYACFVQGFVHYRAGMRGTIDILPA